MLPGRPTRKACIPFTLEALFPCDEDVRDATLLFLDECVSKRLLLKLTADDSGGFVFDYIFKGRVLRKLCIEKIASPTPHLALLFLPRSLFKSFFLIGFHLGLVSFIFCLLRGHCDFVLILRLQEERKSQ